MIKSYSIKNKILRAGFYILSVGGLLTLFSGSLFILWNKFFVLNLQYAPVSLLESMGLVSIAYVVYSAVRFSALSEECHQSNYSHTKSSSQICIPPSNFHDVSQELNSVQKEELKREIERCCGKSVSQPKLEA